MVFLILLIVVWQSTKKINQFFLTSLRTDVRFARYMNLLEEVVHLLQGYTTFNLLMQNLRKCHLHQERSQPTVNKITELNVEFKSHD